MDRFTHFGLRSDADEQLRRAVRDGFKRAGLTHTQLTQAMEWYRDRGQRMGPDPAKLTESFTEFAASKNWPAEHRDAAVSVYGTVRDHGPAAVIAPTSPEQDAATIARATELLRIDQAAYWRDVELRDANYEALERQERAGAPVEALVPGPTTPPPAATPPGRGVDQQRHDEIVGMMRDPSRSGEYWKSQAIQQEFRDVVTRLNGETPAGGSQVSVAPVQPSAPAPADASAVRI
jgi:hypothetical protein